MTDHTHPSRNPRFDLSGSPEARLEAWRDLVVLYLEMESLTSTADALNFGRSLAGLDYAEKCHCVVYAIACIKEYDAQRTTPETTGIPARDAGYGDFGPM